MYMRLMVGRITPKHREAYLRTIHEDALGANTKEPYNVNYFVSFGLPPNDDITMILQVYRDKRGYYAHIETPHSKQMGASFAAVGEAVWEQIDLTGKGGKGAVLEMESFMPPDDEWRYRGVRKF